MAARAPVRTARMRRCPKRRRRFPLSGLRRSDGGMRQPVSGLTCRSGSAKGMVQWLADGHAVRNGRPLCRAACRRSGAQRAGERTAPAALPLLPKLPGPEGLARAAAHEPLPAKMVRLSVAVGKVGKIGGLSLFASAIYSELCRQSQQAPLFTFFKI